MKTTSKTNKNNNHNNLGFKIDSGQVQRAKVIQKIIINLQKQFRQTVQYNY